MNIIHLRADVTSGSQSTYFTAYVFLAEFGQNFLMCKFWDLRRKKNAAKIVRFLKNRPISQRRFSTTCVFVALALVSAQAGSAVIRCFSSGRFLQGLLCPVQFVLKVPIFRSLTVIFALQTAILSCHIFYGLR